MTRSTTTVLPGPRTTAVLLVSAVLLEVVELSTSPLDGHSTRKDLVGIAAHQGRFQLSVVLGVLATLMFAPAFLGLAAACAPATPRLARVAGWTAVAATQGFMGVRMTQAVQLAGIREHVSVSELGATMDHVATNAIGASIAVVFLLGAFVALVLLAVAGWRAGLPKPACVLLALFQPVDFVSPLHPPLSHLMLLVAVGWIGVALWRRDNSRDAVTAVVPVMS